MTNNESDVFRNASVQHRAHDPLLQMALYVPRIKMDKKYFSRVFKIIIIILAAQIPGHFVAITGENTGRLKPKANK